MLNESIKNQDLEMRERYSDRNKKLLGISTKLTLDNVARVNKVDHEMD